MKLIKTLRARNFTLYTENSKGTGFAFAVADTFSVEFGKFDTLDFNSKSVYNMVNQIDRIVPLSYKINILTINSTCDTITATNYPSACFNKKDIPSGAIITVKGFRISNTVHVPKQFTMINNSFQHCFKSKISAKNMNSKARRECSYLKIKFSNTEFNQIQHIS